MSVTHVIAMDDDLQGNTVRVRQNYKDLKAIGESYVTFLQKVGQSDTPVTQEEVAPLFAPQCKKIENGTVLFTSSNVLPDQLNTARQTVGK